MPACQAPTEFETGRFLLRKPVIGDVPEIFERYASDPDVCRYLAWPRHQSLDDTRAFIAFSDAQWAGWPAGPYLVIDRESRAVLGGTGLAFEQSEVASTGYVIAREFWGMGCATECVTAMRNVAEKVGVRHLYAKVYRHHVASQRVLLKAGFTRDGTLRQHFEFPNLRSGQLFDVISYSWRPDSDGVKRR